VEVGKGIKEGLIGKRMKEMKAMIENN